MGKGGMVHLMSPATAAATAIAGKITNANLFESQVKK
jgi:3-isopropylmalate/(R)-2-methylmalate dehydratase large subunit